MTNDEVILLKQILRISSAFSVHLLSQPSFLRRLIDRLLTHGKAVVRLNLLRITKCACDATTDVRTIITKSGLVAAVNRLADQDTAILVRELAKVRRYTHVPARPWFR
jgi:hypothetical protein